MINNKTITNISEEVAPFSRRIINPENLGSSKILNKIAFTKKTLNSIKDTTTKNCFNSLYEKVINETNNIENISDGIIELSQKIDLIKNKDTKELILNEVKKLTQLNKKEFRQIFLKKMEFIETATDAVNIMNNKYLNIKSEPREFYQWLDKRNSWFTDVIDGKIGTENNFRNGFATNKNSKMEYDSYLKALKNVQELHIPETFQKNLKLEAFRKLIDDYNFIEPNIIQKIYHNEYLSKLPPNIRKILCNINKTYNTLVINSNDTFNINDAKYIEEELKLWKQAGMNSAILPKIINIDILDKELNQKDAFGMAYNFNKKISLANLLDIDTNTKHSNSTIRHEINHLNDETIKPKNDFESLYDFLKWKINKFIYEKQWKSELKNSGISDFSTNYAMKNQHELKSVTSESIMIYLSKKFKNQLVYKFKMQPWIFNLKPNKIRLEEINRKLEKEAH